MAAKLLYIFVALAALAFHTTLALPAPEPQPTDFAQDHWDASGWTPSPTAAPEIRNVNLPLYVAELRRRQSAVSIAASADTCGFAYGNFEWAVTCVASGHTCSYDVGGAFGCCSIGATTPCAIVSWPKSCYDYTSSSMCTGSCLTGDSSGLVCDSVSSMCIQEMLVGVWGGTTKTYTQLGCDTTRNFYHISPVATTDFTGVFPAVTTDATFGFAINPQVVITPPVVTSPLVITTTSSHTTSSTTPIPIVISTSSTSSTPTTHSTTTSTTSITSLSSASTSSTLTSTSTSASLTSSPISAPTPTPTPHSNAGAIGGGVGGGAAVILLICLGWCLWHRQHKKKVEAQQFQHRIEVEQNIQPIQQHFPKTSPF